jgi:hypothetical protein
MIAVKRNWVTGSNSQKSKGWLHPPAIQPHHVSNFLEDCFYMTEVNPEIGKKSFGVFEPMKMVDARNLRRPKEVAAATISMLDTDLKRMHANDVEPIPADTMYAHSQPKRVFIIDSGTGANTVNSVF